VPDSNARLPHLDGGKDFIGAIGASGGKDDIVLKVDRSPTTKPATFLAKWYRIAWSWENGQMSQTPPPVPRVPPAPPISPLAGARGRRKQRPPRFALPRS